MKRKLLSTVQALKIGNTVPSLSLKVTSLNQYVVNAIYDCHENREMPSY
jgi:hypothetical protein